MLGPLGDIALFRNPEAPCSCEQRTPKDTSHGSLYPGRWDG